MENEFFLNAGIPPPFSTWQSLSSVMEIQTPELNCSSEHSPEYFFHKSNWEKSTDQNIQFDSALSSMVSSPAASNSNISNDSFVIRELIGKLGNIGNSGEISSHSQPLLAAPANSNTSCYSTPLNSPPKPKFPLNSTVAEFSADPGFAERAARFSCFGSKSFNGRTSQFGLNNTEFTRVSSTPSLNALGSQMGVHQNKNSPFHDRIDLSNSQENSTVSEQNPHGETGLKALNDINSKKRKSNSRVTAKKPASSPSQNATKVLETNEHTNAKRCKPIEANENENSGIKTEEEPRNAGDDKQTKSNQKTPEPPKDYIHVRARRGQATDSHSLAERVRREKISERMKLLQDLVPGCNKVTGKALMLDEIINYVQSLQRQVEFLSMKLSSVNTKLNVETQNSKEMFQSNNSLQHPIFPVDASASAILGHQTHSNNANGKSTHFSVDPLDSSLYRNLMHLPHLDGFNQNLPLIPIYTEGDLQTIVQMGLGQNLNEDMKNFLGK